jgi:hypothetical protein
VADNTTLNTGSGGDTLATDDIGGVKYPRSKIVIGADGTNDGDVSSANPLPVSLASVPSHAVTNAGTFAVQASQTGTWTVQPGNTANTTAWLVTGTGGTFPITDNAGSITVDAPVGTPAFVRLSDGTSAITTLPVSLASVPSHAVTNAGTFAVQAAQSGTWNVGTVTTVSTVTAVTTVTTLTTCGTVTTLTGSGVAHDAADSGNPHKVGAKAIASLSGATLVAAADRTDLYAGVDGVLITRPHSNLEDLVSGTADITDGSSTSVIAAAGAGVKVYVSDIIISNSSASAVTVTIRDGAAGSVKATIMVPAGAPVHKTLQCPIAFSANTAVCADPSAAASTVSVTLAGFKSKV